MLEVHAILQRQRCNENITKKTGTLSDAYPFFMPKREFIGCYKNSAVMLGADQVEKVKITAEPEKVVMRLTF